MKAGNIHPIRIAFGIPVGPDRTVERFVYSYVLDGERLCLIDTGVAQTEGVISKALETIGKNLSDVDIIILTHSHPDHIGAASLIQRQSGAQVWAHRSEQAWIENTERQGRERPIPGFARLVSGPVTVNRLLSDDDILSLGKHSTLRVLHTPGHSAGSLSLLSDEQGVLFCGDAIPQPGDMPIYEDVSALANSLVRLAEIENLTVLYSSWADPLYGQDATDAIWAGIRYLKTIDTVVMRATSELNNPDPMELCKRCVQMLELPEFAVNPLVTRSFLAHQATSAQTDLESILGPFLRGDSDRTSIPP
jgi:glyoxylase-like metal-dependent hydrolase (beta-lactamase superfamily II)